jgi:hypothetical protein
MLWWGILCSWFYDDGFFLAADAETLLANLLAAKQILRWAGHRINEVKSSQEAESIITYLGFVIDIPRWWVSIKPRTMEKLRANLVSLRMPRRWSSPELVDLLQKVIGQLNFVQNCVRQVAPLKAPLIRQQLLAEKNLFWTLDAPTQLYLARIQVLVRDDLAGCEIRSREVDLATIHDHQTSTDACLTGFGGWGFDASGRLFIFYGDWSDLRGIIPIDFAALQATGRETADLSVEEVIIADLELLTFMMAAQLLLPHIRKGCPEKFFNIRCDNSNVVSWINNHYASDRGLLMHQRRTEWLFAHGAVMGEDNLGVSSSYIATDFNFTADRLSRRGDSKRATVLAELLLSHPDHVRVPIPQDWHPGWRPSPP